MSTAQIVSVPRSLRFIDAFGAVLGYALFYFVFGFVSLALEYAIEQPHVTYLDGSLSVQFELVLAIKLGFFLAVIMTLSISADAIWGLAHGSIEVALYRPRLSALPSAWKSIGTRSLFILTGLALLVYWGVLYEEYLRVNTRQHGLIWPPMSIWMTINVLWAVAWIGELKIRKGRKPWLPCVVFAVYAFSIASMFSIMVWSGYPFTIE